MKSPKKPSKIKTEPFSAIVAVRNPSESLDIPNIFNATQINLDTSPIDQFIENTVQLNKMWATRPSDDDISEELGILLLLGYVSAVESYMRSLIRSLVCYDKSSRKNCLKLSISFGAAVHHSEELLPEALLEETVFSSEKEIPNALDKFLGVKLNDNASKSLLTQYGVICQIRHCCVHRFGKLGVKNANAMELDLDSHRNLLEKPIKLNKRSISIIADILTALVKSINNEVFKIVLVRTVKKKSGQTENGVSFIDWTWHRGKDRKIFSMYYKTFSSTKDAKPSPSESEIYERFKLSFKDNVNAT